MRYLHIVRRAATLLAPHRAAFAAVVAVTLLGGLASGVADPLIQKYLFDVLAERRLTAFVTAAAGVIVLATALRAVAHVAAIATQRLNNEMARRLAVDAFRRYYDLAYPEVLRRDGGYFMARVYDEPSRLVPELTSLLLNLLAAAVTFVGAAAVCLWLSWKLALVLSLAVPLVLWLSGRYGGRIADISRSASEREAALRDDLGRAIGAYKTVNLFGLGTTVVARLSSLLRAFQTDTLERARQTSAYQALSGAFLSYAELLVLLGAGLAVLRGELTIGGLFAFMGAFWQVIRSFESLTGLVPSLANVQAALDRLDEFAALPGRPAVRPGAEDAAPALRDASFRWGEREVLSGVSLRLERGQRLLVTGPNGSGKSTLAHVLAGLLPVEGGEQDAPRPEALSALLLPFAFVPGSLRDNLAFHSLDDAGRAECLRLAGRLGLADRLDQDPASLSQGEQRKAQVVMTLLRRARWYLFDEPLANLDPAAKAVVMETILECTAGAGLLVIMHGEEQFHGAFDAHLDLAHGLSRAA